MLALLVGCVFGHDPYTFDSGECEQNGYVQVRANQTIGRSGVGGFRVTVDDAMSDAWEVDASIDLINRSVEDCPVAVYLSRGTPDLTLAPELAANVVPPGAVPGFGQLVDAVLLSRYRGEVWGQWEVHVVETESGPGEVWYLVVACEGIEADPFGEVTSCDGTLDRAAEVRIVE
jgi:hypothetical protein